MIEQAWLNGEVIHSLPFNSRLVQFGDAVFRTILFYESAAYALERQVAHWHRDIRNIGLSLSSSEDEVIQSTQQICGQLDVAEARLKLIATAADEAAGYGRRHHNADWLLLVQALPERDACLWTQGVTLVDAPCRWRRNVYPSAPKLVSRAELIVNHTARQQGEVPDCDELLVHADDGSSISGSMSNIGIVKDHRVIFQPPNDFGVAGLTQELIRESAQLAGLKVATRPIRQIDLEEADACFVCNSLIGIWPVAKYNDLRWDRHPVIEQLMVAFDHPLMHAMRQAH